MALELLAERTSRDVVDMDIGVVAGSQYLVIVKKQSSHNMSAVGLEG